MGKVTSDSARIDFKAAAGRANLEALLVARLGQADRRRRWRCPFHDDWNPSLGLMPSGKAFKCFVCNARGDALDLLTRLDGLDVVEAARRLDPSIPPGRRGGGAKASPAARPAPPRPAERRSEPWESPGWQAAADAIVRRAEARLWSPEGREALAWLRARGLEEHTIRRFRLGFVADADRSGPLEVLGGKPIVAARGITIPWVAPRGWYPASSDPTDGEGRPAPRWAGVNVRRLMPEASERWGGPNKCLALAGSRRGFAYPHDDPTPGEPLVIVEGEFDALVAFQEFGHLVEVATVGGAGQSPRPEALDAFEACSPWLIATDHDGAGDEAASRWRARSPAKARRLHLPAGKDLNDFHVAGGDLRAWLAAELARLGMAVPTQTPR